MLKRYEGNPILKPIPEHDWETLMVYNAAAVYEAGRVHIVYRAQAVKGSVSWLGYASSKDGFHIDKRLEDPIYPNWIGNELECRGAEDPRITKIADRFYMCYTAVGNQPGMHGKSDVVQVGITSISVSDFLNHQWNWSRPFYPFPRVDDKNTFLFPEKIKGRWVMYHRIPPHIWVAYSDDLKHWYGSTIVMSPKEVWEYHKLGAGAPAIKTEEGWLFIYHAVDSKRDYRLGLALIDLENPEKIVLRARRPLLEPEEKYELRGLVSNVVFSCGAVLIDDTVFVYYGGADTVICVATARVSELLDFLKRER